MLPSWAEQVLLVQERLVQASLAQERPHVLGLVADDLVAWRRTERCLAERCLAEQALQIARALRLGRESRARLVCRRRWASRLQLWKAFRD